MGLWAAFAFKNQNTFFLVWKNIAIKSGLEIDSIKKLDSEFYRSTWINSEKLKKIFKVLIFYIKKLRKNSYKYKLYIL